MVPNYNHQQSLLSQRPLPRERRLRNYATIINVTDMTKILGLLIAGACCVPSGRQLWEPENSNLANYNFTPNPDFSRFMAQSKFNLICGNFPYCFAQFEKNGTNPWWLVLDGIEHFNKF